MKTGGRWGKKVVVLAVAMVTAFGTSNSARGSQTCGATPGIPSGSPETDSQLPFVLYDGYLITVEARIGSLRRLRFALDTGATHSALRTGVAKGPALGRWPVRVVHLDHVLTQELLEVADFSSDRYAYLGVTSRAAPILSRPSGVVPQHWVPES